MAADAAHGGDLAKRRCDSCHLIEGGQKQASADVPFFAAIAAKSDFSPEKVAYFLLDPHPKMPNFPLSRARGHRRLYRFAAKITNSRARWGRSINANPCRFCRQGSAERMTDGERVTRWPIMDLQPD
jgi:hypothetical protein